jgi:hypothetical protein
MVTAAGEDSLADYGRALVNRQAYAAPKASEYEHLTTFWRKCCEGDMAFMQKAAKKGVDFQLPYK